MRLIRFAEAKALGFVGSPCFLIGYLCYTLSAPLGTCRVLFMETCQYTSHSNWYKLFGFCVSISRWTLPLLNHYSLHRIGTKVLTVGKNSGRKIFHFKQVLACMNCEGSNRIFIKWRYRIQFLYVILSLECRIFGLFGLEALICVCC